MASENFALDSSERSLILKSVIGTARRLDPKLPIVAGVAPTGYAPALEQGRQAVDAGADLLMVLPPFLVKASGDQLSEFYGRLASELGVPIMVQDAPLTTGVTISEGLIADLAKLPGVEYVKVEAPPTAPKVAKVAQLVRDQMAIFGGQNGQFLLEELSRGAVGTMPACEFTDFLAVVLSAYRDGDAAGANEQFTRLLPLLIYGLQSGIAWAVHKEILARRGIIASPRVRAPAAALDRSSHEGLLRALGPFEKMTSWQVL